jgi:hypothetical protein
MKTATVLGAGELGKACALALAAGGIAAVRLLTRDVNLAALDTVGKDKAHTRSTTSCKDGTPSSWPSAIQFCDVRTVLNDAAALPHYASDPLFICTPINAYLSATDAWAKTTFGNEHNPVTHDVLKRWCSRRRVPPSTTAAGSRQRAVDARFVCTLTRGFAADGGVPAQLVDDLLNGSTSPSAPECESASGGRSTTKGEVPVLVAAGPLLATAWAQQCIPAESNPADAVPSFSQPSSLSADASSFIPPRPRSALSSGTEEGRESAAPPLMKAETNATTAAASAHRGLLYPHTFSGVSLSFAAWTPSTHLDSGRQEALAQQLVELFPRESVTYLREPDAAAVLSIINGCAPLCSFGAGLVSSVYTGPSVTALASYAQHAAVATEKLVNQLLGRPCGTPLPLPALSTLNCACTCFASREFALGRQLDFYFRKQDAVQAIFRGRTHGVFAATVDGLHTRMQTSHVTSPFYEVLMDTYNTMIRASRAGEGLVKEGYYDYREPVREESALLRHAVEVDEAVLSGDENRFTAAKERLVQAFPGAVIY